MSTAFMAAGGSFVTLPKAIAAPRCARPAGSMRGFYLGSIGGPAARLAQDCIKKVELLEYPELGMEAIWRHRGRRLPGLYRRRRQGQRFLRRPLVKRTVAPLRPCRRAS